MSHRHVQPETPNAVSFLLSLLKEEPIPMELGIAILRVDDDEDNTGGEGSVTSGGQCASSETDDASASSKYPYNAFLKVDCQLGINAGDLPALAHDFREFYYYLRRLRPSSDSLANKNDTSIDEDEWLKPFWSRIIDVTSCLLLVCPDNSTAWADRSRALLYLEEHTTVNKSALFMSELRFLDLVFTQHSKKPSAWVHRKWTCRRVLQCFLDDPSEIYLETETWTKLIDWATSEVTVMTRIAELNPKNYYAWTHRLFVTKTLLQTCLQEKTKNFETAANQKQHELKSGGHSVYNFLKNEVESTEPWLRRHVSDHSSVSYGTEVLRMLIKLGIDRAEFRGDDPSTESFTWALNLLSVELVKIRNLLLSFSSHEVIWIYRRNCAFLFLSVATDNMNWCDTGMKPIPLAVEEINRFLTIEVIDTFHESVESYSVGQMTPTPDVDKIHAHSHAMTYIFWVYLHMKRFRLDELLGDFSNMKDIGTRATAALVSDGSITHNLWRFISNQENDQMLDGKSTDLL